MTDTIPGLKVHEHEGKFADGFELPPADLAAVNYDGRTMLVVVADVGAPLKVTQDKDGINKVHWTFHVADVAIVRDEGMREHLSKTLHVHADGVDQHPLDVVEAQSAARPAGMIGLYDSKGAFLGFKPEDEELYLPKEETHKVIPMDEEELSMSGVDSEDTGYVPPDEPREITKADRTAEIYEARGSDDGPPPPVRRRVEPLEGEEVIERIGGPIPVRDPVLAKSLKRGIDG